MDNVLLIKLDTQRSGTTGVPLGPLYLADALEKAHFNVKIMHSLEFRNVKAIFNSAIETIKEINPIFVGFSVMTGMQTEYSAKLSRIIKKSFPNISIVWGGVHPTIATEECLKEDYIDIIIRSEGEKTIVELAKAIKERKYLGEILGISYKDGSKIIHNDNRPLMENEELDNYTPAWHLINFGKKGYFNEQYAQDMYGLKKIAQYYSSRGCPYKCKFCFNVSQNTTRWRAHSAEKVIKDIELLRRKYGIDGVIFHDDNFFINKKRTFEILQKIGIPYFAEVRNDMITEEIGKLLSETRCMRLHIGAESGSDKTLEMINKKFDVDTIIKSTEILAKYKIPVNYSFVVGFPGETWQMIKKTFLLIEKLANIYNNNYFLFNPKPGVYVPYPGNPMWEKSIDYGFVPPSKMEDWSKLNRYESQYDFPWINTRMLQDIINFNFDRKTYLKIRHRKLTLRIVYKLFFVFLTIPTAIKYIFFPFDVVSIYRIFKFVKKIGLFVDQKVIRLKEADEFQKTEEDID